jgi:ABC-type amino acid transport substrate-binding protein
MRNFVLCILVFFSFTHFAHAQSVFDQVTQTKTLRCGYAPWPSLIDVDPNTGDLSGTFYDYMNVLGEAMGLKIVWTTELGFGDMIEALNTNKVDAICSGAWTNPIRGQSALAVTPISYQAVNAYTRADEKRFDGNLDSINDSSVKIATIDGESAETIAKTDFSKAVTVQLPQMTSASEMLVNVSTGKADVAFVDRHVGLEFMKNNPGKIKEIKGEFPLRLFGNPIWIKQGEFALQNALNIGTYQLLNTGSIEKILIKYEKYPGTFYRAAKTYESAE